MSSLRLLLLHFLALSIAVSVSGHGGGGGDSDAGGEHRDLRSGSLVRTKIWCLIVVFFGTFAGGVSPYFLKWNERFLELGTQFAGGVFLGTALMHFLSDSNETFQDLTDKGYPFAFMLACAGYLLTMLADCTLSSVYANPTNRSVDPEVQGVVQTGKFSESGQPAASHCQVLRGTHATTTSLGDSILLIMALCFHSVFEGIAIGVAETEGDAWKALWTICLHKIFAAIAMGIALLQIIPDRPLLSCAAYAFAFAISSPIGVGIGIIIDATTQGVVADWIFAISMGLACGVFIYVCINHLLSKVHLPQKTAAAGAPLHRFLAVLLGVGVIAVVMIWDT